MTFIRDISVLVLAFLSLTNGQMMRSVSSHDQAINVNRFITLASTLKYCLPETKSIGSTNLLYDIDDKTKLEINFSNILVYPLTNVTRHTRPSGYDSKLIGSIKIHNLIFFGRFHIKTKFTEAPNEENTGQITIGMTFLQCQIGMITGDTLGLQTSESVFPGSLPRTKILSVQFDRDSNYNDPTYLPTLKVAAKYVLEGICNDPVRNAVTMALQNPDSCL